MKRLVATITLIVLGLSTSLGCAEGSQTFCRYDICFTISSELQLEEYSLSSFFSPYRKGPASFDEGVVLGDENSFLLLWLSGPELAPQATRTSILSTTDMYSGSSGTLRVEITSDLATEQVSGFELTYAEMRFARAGWESPGITAVWYCPASKRAFQVVMVHNHPNTEMKRFIRSFSCALAS